MRERDHRVETPVLTSNQLQYSLNHEVLSSFTPSDLALFLSKIKQELSRRDHSDSSSALGVPVEIFSCSLAPAESLVKYLKEELHMKFSEIGKAISRDERGIWNTYRRAKVKMPEPFSIGSSMCILPLSIFSSVELSTFESVILYLVDQQQLHLKQLAAFFHKSYSTLYTTYRRAKHNLGGGSE